MSVLRKTIKLSGIVSLVALLSACGGAPSDAQVRKALTEKIDNDIQQIANMPGLEGSGLEGVAKSMTPNVEEITPHGCEAADNDLYNCTVEMTVTMMGIEQTSSRVFQLTKADGQWKVLH